MTHLWNGLERGGHRQLSDRLGARDSPGRRVNEKWQGNPWGPGSPFPRQMLWKRRLGLDVAPCPPYSDPFKPRMIAPQVTV
jgi:hypothetical protein